MGERGRPKYPDVLTPRQYEVLELVREGLTNPQIAERLGISPDGAKWHVKEILWKLDVPSRRDAAQWDAGREKQEAGSETRERAPSAQLKLEGRGWRVGGLRSGRCRFRRSGVVPKTLAGFRGAVAWGLSSWAAKILRFAQDDSCGAIASSC